MSYGAYVHAARQERLDAQRHRADRRSAMWQERDTARQWVTRVGLLDEQGQPCTFAIFAALQLRCEHGPGRVTRQMVDRRRRELLGRLGRGPEAA